MSIEDLKVKPEILSPKPPSIASDEEFAAGTSTTASPTVKQAKEKLVTTDTTQTITGTKVFTTLLLRKSTNIDITTQPENYTTNNGFQFVDKNGKIMGFLENSQQADGRIKTAIHARNKDNYQQNISVWVPPSGTTGAYATAPSTPANPGANVIVTADYVKNNYVTLNTNQAITGVKTYTATQIKKSTIADISTTPDGYQANEVIRACDKNNNFMGVYHTSVVPAALGAYDNTGEVRCAMDVLNKDGYQAGIRVNVPVEGTSGAYASCPSYDENNAPANAIVTKDKIANMVTTNTAQTISGSKRFTKPSGGMSIEFTADTNQQTVPTTATLRQLGLYRNATYTKGDGYTSWLQGLRGSDGWTATELYARRFLESDSQEIINYLRVNVTPEGVPISYTRTPPAVSAGEEIVTAGWFNSKMQVVSALPANPDPNVFYFIPG